jgi:hypothetical protein
MKNFLFLAILSLLVLFLGCATNENNIQETPITSEKCDAPMWNVGDSWTWQNDLKRSMGNTVKSIETSYYVVEDRYGVDKPCLKKKNLDIISYIPKEILSFQGSRLLSILNFHFT